MLVNIQGWINSDFVVITDLELPIFLRHRNNGGCPITVVDLLQDAHLFQPIDLRTNSIPDGKGYTAGSEKLGRGITLQLQLSSDILHCAQFIFEKILVALQ